ncbi:MAG: methionyl-tRNA formyltransferase [Coriobacteriia bacterium]
MRVVFMGTPEFAVPSLRALVEAGVDVVAVYTRPDAVSGRGSSRRPSPVCCLATELGLPVVQPRTLRDAEEQERLRALSPDLIVVVAYGLILPNEVLAIPALDTINVHASLLSRWRGAAPIQHAILAGDAITGVTIMRVTEGLDAGPFCARAEMPVDELSAPELTAALAELGASLLVSTLPSIEAGAAEWHEQDESRVTYASKVGREDVAIAPSMPAEAALRRIRASAPSAPSRVLVGGKAVTLLEARLADVQVPPAQVQVAKDALLLGVSGGTLAITRLKPESRGAMDATAWARGVRDLDGATWGRLS